METLEYSLNAEREGGGTDPQYLRAVDAFAEWLRGQPEVVHVQAFPDIMKRLNRNMHGDDPAFHRLPDDPELAAQYFRSTSSRSRSAATSTTASTSPSPGRA